MNETTIVFLTAMNLEYDAIRVRLSGLTPWTHPMGTRFEVGHLNGNDGSRAVLALTGKGNQSAAVLAERAMAEFDPAAVFFVGVAGALRTNLSLGDVVVATHVYAYHGATSQDDGLTARPRAWELSHRVQQIAAHLQRTGDWAHELPVDPSPPRLHFGPIAAGEIVHYSAESSARGWLRDHYSDAIAVEMEGAGVAQAAHLNDALPAIMVRGISDYADQSKSATDTAGWQPRAATNAAAFAAALAAALTGEDDSHHRLPRTRSGDTGHGSHTNLATGNAHVGVQGEHVIIHGGIQMGAPGGEAVRSTAEKDQTAIRRDKVRQVLKSLYGALHRIADLAAGAAAIMTTVRGLT